MEPKATLAELAQLFDVNAVTKSAAKFDPDDVGKLNVKLVQDMGFSDVEERLSDAGIGGGEVFWNAVRGNINTFNEAGNWWKVVQGPISPDVADEDKDFIAQATELLPAEPWDETTWSAWTSACKAETGRKGKGLFMPLRRALTGLSHGPELAAILPILGRTETLARLRG